MLIVIEGVDGCGKDTVADRLAASRQAERLNFPNDQGVTGPLIRAYLKQRWSVFSAALDIDDDAASAMVFQTLQIVNRLEVSARLEAARRGTPDLVLARYWQSGWVYGQLDGLSEEWLTCIHRTLVQADLNVLLDIEPEVSMARREARDGKLPAERYEGKLTLARRTVELYRSLWDPRFWERSRDKQVGRWVKVDATQSVDAVVAAVQTAIEGVRGA